MTDICHFKKRLLLQFHITGRCNLRCKHCYRTEGDVETLSFDDIKSVIDGFLDLRLRFNEQNGTRRRGHINITGGEPFYRKDIKEILLYLGQKRDVLSYGVLSNGSFIDDDIINILRGTEASFVQLSIDGDRETHDLLRAKGDFDRVLKTAARLEAAGIPTHISFTANRENYRHLPLVAKKCRQNKVTKLWSDRLVPIGNGEEMQALAIGPDALMDYVNTLKRARGGAFIRITHPKTTVTMNRALQFMGSKGDIYSCSAGNTLITVDELGNIMPCRRMPIICGKVATDTLEKVYFENEVFRALRADNIPTECIGCKYALFCRGGAKCQAYAVSGSFKAPDPACPLLNQKR